MIIRALLRGVGSHEGREAQVIAISLGLFLFRSHCTSFHILLYLPSSVICLISFLLFPCACVEDNTHA